MTKKSKFWNGTAWEDLASSQPDLSNYPSYTAIQFGFRNKIINGDFRINQRAYSSGSTLSTSDSKTPVGYGYCFDRWKATTSGTYVSFFSSPNGQLITISASGSIAQIIERENISNGTYTLSWQGTATGRVYNVGASAPAYTASPVTVSLDGTANVIVEFAAVALPKTLNLVQLEQGGKQTSFEYRPVSVELTNCQRYYYRITAGTAYGTLSTSAWGWNTTSAEVPIQLPVTMRVPPTVSDTGGAKRLTYSGASAISVGTGATINTTYCSQNVGLVEVTGTGITAGAPYTLGANNDATAYVGFSSEL